MTARLPNGRFTLATGVRLIADTRGGVVLQSSPLRALRVNASAFRVLLKCQPGQTSGESLDK